MGCWHFICTGMHCRTADPNSNLTRHLDPFNQKSCILYAGWHHYHDVGGILRGVRELSKQCKHLRSRNKVGALTVRLNADAEVAL